MNPFDEIGLDLKATAKSELRNILEQSGGVLRTDQAQAIADTAGVEPRTVWNWARAIRPHCAPPVDERTFLERIIDDGRPGFAFDDLAVAMVYAVGGNLKRFWKDLVAAFGKENVPSYSQLTRLWDKVHPMVKAGAKTGLKHRSKFCLYLQHFATRPNEAWQLDEFILDFEVHAPNGATRTVSPRLLLLVDVWDRLLVGWALLPREPNAADVAALIADAMQVRLDGPSRVVLGGAPGLILFDNAKAFTADYVTDALVALGSIGRAVTPYMPTAKGVVERTGQTIQELIVAGVAGVKTQAESWSKEDLFRAATVNLITWEHAVAHVARRIDFYNREHVHSSIGMTPLQKRATWTVPPTPVDEAEIGALWLEPAGRSGTRIVSPQGVAAFSQQWASVELDPFIGREVTVKAPHHRRDCVAVFADGEFICMAVPHQELDTETRSQILASRNEHIREVNRAAKSARVIQAEQSRIVADGGRQQVVDATLAALAPADPDHSEHHAGDEPGGTTTGSDSETARADSRARPASRPPKRTKRGDGPAEPQPSAAERKRNALDIAQKAAEAALGQPSTEDETEEQQ